jgi:GAF domain-containing protein
MNESDYRAAIAAGLVGAEETHHALLYSIVETARAIFGAGGSSIFLLDEETDELVFEAICGPGDEELLGQRFPSSTGIAGWVLATRQPLVLEDVAEDPRFARDFAAQTGYVPRGLMAVPLLHEERALGVLEVLDRRTDRPFSLDEMNLLALFAGQAAIALSLLGDARRARRLLDGAPDELAATARVAEALDRLEGKDRTAASRLLEALSDVLKRR